MANNVLHYCRHCKAAILWVTTAKGNKMPIDYRVDLLSYHDYKPGVHTPHFITCPGADKFRKPKKVILDDVKDLNEVPPPARGSRR